jgi:alkylation response protein AidB-like acyl-CoA dehydrogenase
VAEQTARAQLLADIREAVAGVTARYDRAYFLKRAREGGDFDEIWEAMAAQELLGVGIAEDLGGTGGGLTGTTAIMETMSQAGVPPLLYASTSFSREAILRHGSEAQIADLVLPTMVGKVRMCLAVTEPDAGTNAFAMRTRAQRVDSGDYVINGQKVFISGADHADRLMLIARTGAPGGPVGRRSGFSLFAVPRRLPGIELRRLDIPWYAPERQFEVFLTDVEVPGDALIGREGEGFECLLSCLNQERVMISAWALGLGDFALRKAVDYANERAPFGKPIGSYQAVQHPLALAKAHMEAARQVMYSAAAQYDDGGDAGAMANMSKLLSSRAALQAVEAAIQTHGGYGFVVENDIITLWPMIRVLQIAPLNNESILNFIGERVLGMPRSY